LVVWTVSSKEIFRKDPSSGFSVGRSIDSILSEIDQKWNITKLLNILIQSNLFKRSTFQVISQFIHVKDISKVNDNGNQYKQKLILWYWTRNYFLMGFTASKIYFYFGTISMFWNLKATISHEFQYLNYSKH
jgi:hypothetical protein